MFFFPKTQSVGEARGEASTAMHQGPSYTLNRMVRTTNFKFPHNLQHGKWVE